MSFEGLEHPIEGTPRMAPGERVKYVPNHRSFGAFIKSEQIRKPTAEVAEDMALLAREFSPVSQRGGNQDGVRMRDRFRVIKEAGFIKVNRNVRVLVEIVNDARSAAPNEFGTKKNKRHRMLGRAGAAFGDFKPEGGPGGGDS